MTRGDLLSQIESERLSAEAAIETERTNAEPLTQPPYFVLSEETNTISFPVGLSGSLTQLTDGSSYLVAGTNVQISSASNGPITISTTPANNTSVAGSNGQVQFNKNGNLGADANFSYDKASNTLSVTNLSASLLYKSNDDFYLKSGYAQTITPDPDIQIDLNSPVPGAVTIKNPNYVSPSFWRNYTPDITDQAAGIEPSVTLPTTKTISGKYLYRDGILKLNFNLFADDAAGAVDGTGAYVIEMPPGFEINTSVVALGSISNLSAGLTIGIASISSETIGTGGAWTVVPLNATQLIITGKKTNETTVTTWSASSVPMSTTNGLRVTFAATIPASIVPVTTTWVGPDVELVGGTFSILRRGPPVVTDGDIYAVEPDGNGGYIVGGSFTRAYPGGQGYGGTTTLSVSSAARSRIQHVNGPVNAIVSDGAGGVYIGGDFSYVGGVARQRLAQINSSGAVTSWNPGCNGPVYAMLYGLYSNAAGGTPIYVAGQFSICGGLTRYNVAAVSTAGSAFSGWYCHLSLSGSYTNAVAYALSWGLNNTARNSNIRIGGRFNFTETPAVTSSRVSNQHVEDGGGLLNLDRTYTLNIYAADGTTPGTVYAIDVVTRVASGLTRYHTVCGGDFYYLNGNYQPFMALYNTLDNGFSGFQWSPNGIVRSVERHGTTTSNNRLVIAGDFTAVTGAGRQYIAALTVGTATGQRQPDAWNPSSSARVYQARIDASLTFVYAAGDFTTFGSRSVNRIAKCNIASSTAEDWNTSGVDVFAGSARAIYTGTVFGDSNVMVGGNDMTPSSIYQTRNNVARMVNDGSQEETYMDATFIPSITGIVRAIKKSGDTVYIGGQFTTVDGDPAYKGLAKYALSTGIRNTTWKPTSGNANPLYLTLLEDGNFLYVGGDSTTTNIAGSGRSYLARIDKTTGAGDSTWMPTTLGTSILDMILNDEQLVVGGAGGISAHDITTGAASTWVNNPGSTVNSLYLVDEDGTLVLYAAGTFASKLSKHNWSDGSSISLSSLPSLTTLTPNAVAANGTYVWLGGSSSNATKFYRLSAVDGSDTSATVVLSAASGQPTIQKLSLTNEKVFIAGSNMDRATNISTFNLIDGLGWIEQS